MPQLKQAQSDVSHAYRDRQNFCTGVVGASRPVLVSLFREIQIRRPTTARASRRSPAFRQGRNISVRPALAIDRAEINEHGFTLAENSRQLATVIEAAIMEIYSAVDCTAKVLRAIYGPSTRGFKESTRFLFLSFDSIKGDFPDALKDILRNAAWYEGLRFLRDELTHLGTGSCHPANATEAVSYMHLGIKTDGKPLIVDDVFQWLSTLIEVVNDFLGRIFLFLRNSLKSTPVMQICGMVEGRMLMRYLDTTQEVTFASGQCHSWQWFEQPDAPTCPFVTNCGAYARVRPMTTPKD
jgi:hypothetical protein